MSKVTISLNGQAFTLGCEEGQQAYLRELAAHLDTRVTGLAERMGQIGEMRLLLMAALTVTDEMREARGRVSELEGEIVDMKERLSQTEAHRRSDRARAVEIIMAGAERLEHMANLDASTAVANTDADGENT